MFRSLSSLALCLGLASLIASWPLSVWLVRSLGSQQPNWFADPRPGIAVLERFASGEALLLCEGSIVFVYPRALPDSWTGRRRIVYGFES